MIIFLVALMVAAAVFVPSMLSAAHFMGVSVIAGAALDYALKRYRLKIKEIPYDSIITSLIISSVIFYTGFLEALALTVIAMALKYIIRLHSRNIFNPAALSIVVLSLFFQFNEAWWVASSLAVFIGLFIAYKVRRLELSVVFLIVYMGLSLGYVMLLQPGAAISISALGGSAAFFAFFMLTEPITSPHKKQWVYGIIAAVFAFGAGFFYPSALLAGLLLINLLWSMELVMKRRAMRTVEAKAS